MGKHRQFGVPEPEFSNQASFVSFDAKDMKKNDEKNNICLYNFPQSNNDDEERKEGIKDNKNCYDKPKNPFVNPIFKEFYLSCSMNPPLGAVAGRKFFRMRLYVIMYYLKIIRMMLNHLHCHDGNQKYSDNLSRQNRFYKCIDVSGHKTAKHRSLFGKNHLEYMWCYLSICIITQSYFKRYSSGFSYYLNFQQPLTTVITTFFISLALFFQFGDYIENGIFEQEPWHNLTSFFELCHINMSFLSQLTIRQQLLYSFIIYISHSLFDYFFLSILSARNTLTLFSFVFPYASVSPSQVFPSKKVHFYDVFSFPFILYFLRGSLVECNGNNSSSVKKAEEHKRYYKKCSFIDENNWNDKENAANQFHENIMCNCRYSNQMNADDSAAKKRDTKQRYDDCTNKNHDDQNADYCDSYKEKIRVGKRNIIAFVKSHMPIFYEDDKQACSNSQNVVKKETTRILNHIRRFLFAKYVIIIYLLFVFYTVVQGQTSFVHFLSSNDTSSPFIYPTFIYTFAHQTTSSSVPLPLSPLLLQSPHIPSSLYPSRNSIFPFSLSQFQNKKLSRQFPLDCYPRHQKNLSHIHHISSSCQRLCRCLHDDCKCYNCNLCYHNTLNKNRLRSNENKVLPSLSISSSFLHNSTISPKRSLFSFYLTSHLLRFAVLPSVAPAKLSLFPSSKLFLKLPMSSFSSLPLSLSSSLVFSTSTCSQPASINDDKVVITAGTGCRVVGVGSAVPSTVLTNQDLSDFLDTSDEWILPRTGISCRRILQASTHSKEATNLRDLTVQASINALKNNEDNRKNNKVHYNDNEFVDLVINATSSSDDLFGDAPYISAQVNKYILEKSQRFPSKQVPPTIGFDITAACSGFIVGLITGNAFLNSSDGKMSRIMVTGGDALSRWIDWEDRNTSILFGDGSGAVILEKNNSGSNNNGRSHIPYGLLCYSLASDGCKAKDLTLSYIPSPHRLPLSKTIFVQKGGYDKICMNGKEIFKFVTKEIPILISKCVDKIRHENVIPGFSIKDVDMLLLHQANKRIIDAVAQKLHIPEHKVISNLSRYGNTSAASIPLCLDEAVREGKVKAGDVIAISGFGAGLTWGAALLRYG